MVSTGAGGFLFLIARIAAKISSHRSLVLWLFGIRGSAAPSGTDLSGFGFFGALGFLGVVDVDGSWDSSGESYSTVVCGRFLLALGVGRRKAGSRVTLWTGEQKD